MPNYRVLVRMALNAGAYTAGARRASGATTKLGGDLDRTAGRGSRAMGRLVGRTHSLGSALRSTATNARRTGTASRRMSEQFHVSITRARRGVDSLIGRMGVLRRASAGGLGSGIGRLAGFAGVAGAGYAAIRVASTVGSLDTIIRRVSRESGRSYEDLQQYKREAYRVSGEQGGTSARDLVQALTAAQGFGGVQIQTKDLPFLAALQARSGLEGPELGKAWAKLALLPGDLAENFALMAAQMDAGQMSFGQFIQVMDRPIASTQKWGGEDATRQMGALIGLMMAGSSSPMMAAETFDATTRELLRNADKIQAKYGIDVMSRTTPGQLRSDLVETILEIGKRAEKGGGEAGLLEVIPAEGVRGIAMALDPEWRARTAAILDVQASTADMVRDAAFVAQSPEFQQQAIQQQIESRMDELMLGPLSRVMQGAQTAAPAAIAVGEIGFGAYIAGKALGAIVRGGRSVLARFGVGGVAGAAGAAAGLGLGRSSIATMRVGVMYVGSMMPGGGAGGGRGRGGPGGLVPVGRGSTAGAQRLLPPAGGTVGRFARVGGVAGQLGRKLPYVGAAVGAVGAGVALAKGDGRLAAERGGGALGGLGGAAAGAALGTLVPVPVVGTVLGGLLGYWLGDKLGANVAGRVVDAVAGEEAAAPEIQAQQPAVANITDNSRIEITVPDAGDPRATAAAVGDELERRETGRKARRDRRALDVVVGDYAPDPSF